MAKRISKARKIAVLKLARRRIEKREDKFICFALLRLGDEDWEAACYMRNYIRNKLYPNEALEGWQKRKLGRVGLSPREDRLLWIDWMIENAT